MAKIIKGNFSYICGNCHASFSLLGILPDIATLKEQGWKYCPKCGEPIEYELTRVVEGRLYDCKCSDKNNPNLVHRAVEK